MTVGDEEVSVRGNSDIVRLAKLIFAGAGNSRRAERHEDLPILVELINHATFAGLALVIRNVEIPLLIHAQSVRRDEQARAETLDQLAVLIKFEDRVIGAAVTGVRAASLDHPKVPVIYGDARDRPPPAAHWEERSRIRERCDRAWEPRRKWRTGGPEALQKGS